MPHSNSIPDATARSTILRLYATLLIFPLSCYVPHIRSDCIPWCLRLTRTRASLVKHEPRNPHRMFGNLISTQSLRLQEERFPERRLLYGWSKCHRPLCVYRFSFRTNRRQRRFHGINGQLTSTARTTRSSGHSFFPCHSLSYIFEIFTGGFQGP